MSALSPIRRFRSVLALAVAFAAMSSSTAAAAPSFEVSLKNAEGSDVQAVFVEANTGQFRLGFDTGAGTVETGDINVGATVGQVADALNAALPVGAGSVSVTTNTDQGTDPVKPYLVAFDGGPLALRQQPLLKVRNGTEPLGNSPFGGPGRAYIATRVVGGIRRGDERTDYTLAIRNAASSDPSVGDQLFCNGIETTAGAPKNWFPEAPGGPNFPSFTVVWLRNGVPIAGSGGVAPGPGQSYTLAAADEGKVIQCAVTGKNTTGGAKYVSVPGLVVEPQPPISPPNPSNRTAAESRPAVSGTGTALRTCSTAAMNWVEDLDGDPGTAATQFTGPFTFQWLRNGEEIPGATASTYTPAIATAQATRTTGSATLTGVTGTTGTFAVGDVVTGTGIAANSKIVSIDNEAGTITLNTAVTAEGTSAITGGADNVKELQCQVIGTNAGGALAGISNNSNVGTVPNSVNLAAAQNPLIEFSNGTSGPVTAEVELPEGFESFAYLPGSGGTGWSCTAQPAAGVQPAKAICTNSAVIGPGASYPDLRIAVGLGADAPDASVVKATVSGGGAATAVSATSEFSFEPFAGFGFVPGRFSARALDSAGEDLTQAGGHPHLATTDVSFNRRRLLVDNGKGHQRYKPVAPVRSAIGDIPPGFIGNPQAVPDLCPSTGDLFRGTCPPASVVGELGLHLKGLGSGDERESIFARYPLYALEPEFGVVAQFAVFDATSGGVYVLQPRLRPGDGYAISVESSGIVENPPILDLRVTLCSYGANLAGTPPFAGFRNCKGKDDSGAYSKPFLTTQTECASSGPVTKLHADSWANPGDFETAEAVAPKMTGCELVPFEPGMSLQPSTKQAESASGLDVEITSSTEGLEDPDGISQAHLKRATVTLPPGMSVNPASADGLAACTQAQLGMVNGVPNNEPVQCPDASKIGTVELKTPILEETLTGNVYLAKQGDNPFGTLLGLYVVAESKERGVLIKIPGKVQVKDKGQLVSTFDDNPQAPFSSLKLNFNSGARAPLMTPQRCGTYQIVSELTPWSAADPDNPTPAETVTRTSAFEITSGPGGGGCPSGALLPTLKAGLSNTNAGESSPFVVALSRNDGTQRFNGLSMTLPPGLTASLKGVAYCPDPVLSSIPTAEGTGAAEIANPSCPAASRLGSVSVGAGAGKPFYVNTGNAYLAGPYKGAPVSLAVVVPAVAGPFDLGNVVVRNPIYVNPKTAQITVKSDPLPTALQNLPVDVRDVRISIDRPNFMRAPTNCEVMSIDAVVNGDEGGSAPISDRFQVGECGSLGFQPEMKIQLKGGTKRNKYQQLTATVMARPGDANIAGASVRFPQSIFLAQNHIRTICTRVQFAAGTCPAGSIYGYAEAETPLLDQPLKGPVYLRSSDNPLPDLVAALQGPNHQPIKVELAGRTDSKNRGLRNTFDVVPDAPVSKFTLRMLGGKKSLLVTSRDICLRKERADVRMRGQNGMQRNLRPVIQVNCKKKKQKKTQKGKKSGKKSR